MDQKRKLPETYDEWVVYMRNLIMEHRAKKEVRKNRRTHMQKQGK